MKLFKTLLCILAVVALVCAFVACKPEEKTNSEATDTETVEDLSTETAVEESESVEESETGADESETVLTEEESKVAE